MRGWITPREALSDAVESLVTLCLVAVAAPFYLVGWALLWALDRLDPDVPRDARGWAMTKPVGLSEATRQATQRCEQCGRTGTRGFKTLGPTFHEPTGYTVPAITVCANTNACMKRWPKPPRDPYEEC